MTVAQTHHELITSSNLTEFFKDSVEDAANNQHLDARPDTVFYIVTLLTSYTRSNRLFTASQAGPQMKTLAEFYFQALSDSSSTRRNQTLRELGDLALFLSGVFSDYLNRRGINIDYCYNMGGGAYAHLASCGDHDAGTANLRHIFEELAEKFERVVDVVAEASSQTQANDDQNLLKLYERWLASGNPKDAVRLRRLGIFPSSLRTDTHH